MGRTSCAWNGAFLLLLLSLPSCDSVSTKPLETTMAGGDPESLDWTIPNDQSPLALLDSIDAARLADLSPGRRAMLQRDLWMAFDKRRHSPPDDPVRERLASLLRVLALPLDQIRSLPDPYVEAAKEYPSNYDPSKPDDPFLPPDLLDPEGRWVVLGGHGSITVQHNSFFRWRSAFAVLVRHPSGRSATLKYVESLESQRLPEIPVGMEFALLRRALLITDQGVPVVSPVTETVQLRHYFGRNGDQQAVFKFELRRKDLQLHAIRPGERKPSTAVSFEHLRSQKSLSVPVLDTCLACHGIGGPSGVGTFAFHASVDLHLRASRLDQELQRTPPLKQADESWQQLIARWSR